MNSCSLKDTAAMATPVPKALGCLPHLLFLTTSLFLFITTTFTTSPAQSTSHSPSPSIKTIFYSSRPSWLRLLTDTNDRTNELNISDRLKGCVGSLEELASKQAKGYGNTLTHISSFLAPKGEKPTKRNCARSNSALSCREVE